MPETPRESEQDLLLRLRSGDECTFASLVDSMHGRLLALARTYTRSPGLAEDIVQETWLAVIRGLHRFEGRSALRTWIYSILVKRARTMAGREARKAAVLRPAESSQADGPEWEPGAGRVGLWSGTPVPWGLTDPATVYQSKEALTVIERAMAEMPEMQRRVLLLRDVEDVSSADVCNTLEISETNLRVLLHRGRARVRRALDRYLRECPEPPARSEGGTTPAPGARPRVSRDRSVLADGGNDGLL